MIGDDCPRPFCGAFQTTDAEPLLLNLPGDPPPEPVLVLHTGWLPERGLIPVNQFGHGHAAQLLDLGGDGLLADPTAPDLLSDTRPIPVRSLSDALHAASSSSC